MTTPRVHVSRLFEPLNCVSASIPCLHHLPSEAATSVNWSNTGLLLRWPVASFPGARLSLPAVGPLVPLSQPPSAPLRGAAPFPSCQVRRGCSPPFWLDPRARHASPLSENSLSLLHPSPPPCTQHLCGRLVSCVAVLSSFLSSLKCASSAGAEPGSQRQHHSGGTPLGSARSLTMPGENARPRETGFEVCRAGAQ